MNVENNFWYEQENILFRSSPKKLKELMDSYRLYKSLYTSHKKDIRLNPLIGCKIGPNLYLGNYIFASDASLLTTLGVTHILNAAREVPNYFNYDSPFQYLQLNMIDNPKEDATRFFAVSKEFIDNAIEDNGIVLIHCKAGISRSVTILISYLMSKFNITAKDALKIVRENRPQVNPNYGFMKQLGLTM